MRDFGLGLYGGSERKQFLHDALVSGVIESQGVQVIDKLVFKGCSPGVRVLVESVIDLGLQKRAERVA